MDSTHRLNGSHIRLWEDCLTNREKRVSMRTALDPPQSAQAPRDSLPLTKENI